MNPKPSPAIVTQDAARRLPRWALLLLCIAYVIPGYVGREPWKNADIASFGYMLALLDAGSWREWLQPSMMGLVPDNGALLPYWLGAWAMQALMPLGLAPEIAARVPYLLMLAGTLVATWYAVYHLARDPSAQPVAFAFGGEAEPVDYARALADGSLLASVPPRSIILIEDVDAFFRQREQQSQQVKLSFLGFLNALDGVAAHEGSVVFMTTNHPETLDEALVRSGRIDFRMELGPCDRHQLAGMFRKFHDDPALAEAFAAALPEGELSPAAVQERLLKARSPTEAFVRFDLPVPARLAGAAVTAAD